MDTRDMIYFGDYSYYLMSSRWNSLYDDNVFRCDIQPDVNIDQLEKVLKNSNNTKRIIVKTHHDNAVALVLENFIELQNIHKHFDRTIGYEIKDGVRVPILSDVIEIELKQMGTETRIQHLQSNMEYMAIMADIDINEE